MIPTDYILDGQAYGPYAQGMDEIGFDPGLRRPFYDSKRRVCVTVNTGKTETRKNGAGQVICNSIGHPISFPVKKTVFLKDIMGDPRFVMPPVANATALRKLEWETLDDIVLRAARARLRAWADLAAANPVSGFDGFSTLIYEHETMSDDGEAVVDMDALAEEREFNPRFQLQGTPLPITHAGFFLSRRKLAVSRKMGTPLDLTKGEMAGRRIAEKLEKTTIGTIAGMTYGAANAGSPIAYGRTPTVYGYTNFPPRITKTNMTAPTGSNGPAVLSSFLALRDLLYAQNMFGPYMVYTSNDWDQYLDNVFVTTAGMGTLRQMLTNVEGITAIRRLDYLANTFTVLMVQMTPDVARAIIGMPLTTVQWEEQGGYMLKFRSLTIQVPQLRADFLNQCGIAHGTTA